MLIEATIERVVDVTVYVVVVCMIHWTIQVATLGVEG